jgi:cytochrome c peroxidase
MKRTSLLILITTMSAWTVQGLVANIGPEISAGRNRAWPAKPPRPPLGLTPVPWPKDAPYTPEKAELGWRLFFEKRISANGKIACASCHAPEHAFTDARPVSIGFKGEHGKRNAPTCINAAYGDRQLWDGRAATLEDQVRMAILNPVETGGMGSAISSKLGGIPDYRRGFKAAFGSESITLDRIAQAIATFERLVLSGDSPYDRAMTGDQTALSASQQRGEALFFGKAMCVSCHSGPLFTNGQFANIGVGMDKPNPDLGRYAITRQKEDWGAFKVPTLREVAHTAPYMHDGSLKTLEEVIDHYNRGGSANSNLDMRIRPLGLNAQEKQDLVEFLKALNGAGWQRYMAPPPLPTR